MFVVCFKKSYLSKFIFKKKYLIISMNSLKNWWYNHEIDNARKTAQKMFNDNKT